MHCGVDLRRAEPQGTIGDPRKHGVKRSAGKDPSFASQPQGGHQMVTRRKQHSSQRPVQQGPAVTASRPNKIGASTPYHFRGKKPTPYGGLLPVVGRALI